jgi:hypothetical protein
MAIDPALSLKFLDKYGSVNPNAIDDASKAEEQFRKHRSDTLTTGFKQGLANLQSGKNTAATVAGARAREILKLGLSGLDPAGIATHQTDARRTERNTLQAALELALAKLGRRPPPRPGDTADSSLDFQNQQRPLVAAPTPAAEAGRARDSIQTVHKQEYTTDRQPGDKGASRPNTVTVTEKRSDAPTTDAFGRPFGSSRGIALPTPPGPGAKTTTATTSTPTGGPRRVVGTAADGVYGVYEEGPNGEAILIKRIPEK